MTTFLAQQDTNFFTSFLGWALYVALVVFVLVGMWRVFEKAGKPGWASIIPFYNVWVMFQIAGRPGWWLFLMFIPLVNIVVVALALYDISVAFGHGFGFFLGLFFLPTIFWMILGYGDSQYRTA